MLRNGLLILAAIIFTLFLVENTRGESHGFYFKLNHNSFFLETINENTISSEKVDSSESCLRLCSREKLCKSANFKKSKRTCTLLKITEKYDEGILMKHNDYLYVEKWQNPEEAGTTKTNPASTCKILSTLAFPPPTGVYWIDPDGGSHANAFKASCDMDTDGGGWTLVWSYTFTRYDAFNTDLNAVIPRPDWSVNSRVDVPISTTPPLNETDYNAVNFSVWKQIGRQVLIKSNINNWLRCDPENGSLVDWQEGAVSCKIVKHVTDTCNERVPLVFLPSKGFGPILSRSNNWGSTAYYYYDGYTTNNWPTHDPCGTNQPNQLKNIPTPHGNIFIR